MARRKKTPDNIWGFSYKHIVRRKDKNGKYYFIEKSTGGKEKRVKKTEFLKAENLKKELRETYGKDWKNKLQDKRKEFKKVDKEEAQKNKELKKEVNKIVASKILWTPFSTFGNSFPTDLESTLIDGSTFYFIFDRVNQIEININNSLDARALLSEVLDKFYDDWKDLQEAYEKEFEKKLSKGLITQKEYNKNKPPSPNVHFNWFRALERDTNLDKSYLIVEYTSFTLAYDAMIRLFKRLIKQTFGDRVKKIKVSDYNIIENQYKIHFKDR